MSSASANSTATRRSSRPWTCRISRTFSWSWGRPNEKTMIFFLLLLVLMFAGLVVQHFIGPLPVIGARVLLMQMVMLYGSLAMPLPGMPALTFAGGLMWDSLNTQWVGDGVADGQVEI